MERPLSREEWNALADVLIGPSIALTRFRSELVAVKDVDWVSVYHALKQRFDTRLPDDPKLVDATGRDLTPGIVLDEGQFDRIELWEAKEKALREEALRRGRPERL